MKYADKSTNFKHLVNGVILAKLTDAGKEFHLFITLLQKKILRIPRVRIIELTHTGLTALFRDYPGEPVPER